MKRMLLVLLLTVPSFAQSVWPSAPSATQTKPAPEHKFFDKKNLVIMGTFATATTFDSLSTQKCISRSTCKEGDPFARPFVGTRKGQAFISGVGYAGGISAMYLFHRLHKHKMERIAGIAMTGIESYLAIRNYRITPAIPSRR